MLKGTKGIPVVSLQGTVLSTPSILPIVVKSTEQGLGWMKTDITVITLTRRRPELLQRAIKSIQAQSAHACISHHIVIDHCPETLTILRSSPLPKNVSVFYMERKKNDVTGPIRAAGLRNQAVASVNSTWVAFLDDDNEYHSSHLAELLTKANTTGCDVVHSYRELRNQDGSPYLNEKDPWCEDVIEARKSYRQLVTAGILTPGSSIMKDSIKAVDRSLVVSVDTSEWLIRTELSRQIPFRAPVPNENEVKGLTEDDTFLQDLVSAGIRIESTGLATLYYYLGGYSTTFGPDAEWQPTTRSWVIGEVSR